MTSLNFISDSDYQIASGLPKNILVKRIKRKIKQSIIKIVKGYDVISKYADGNDEYGFLYFVYCRNGYEAESCYVRPTMIDAVKMYLKSIIENGIEYNNNLYYLDENLYYQIMVASTNTYYKYVFEEETNFKFKINLISYPEFKKYRENQVAFNSVKDNIIENFKKKIDDYKAKYSKEQIAIDYRLKVKTPNDELKEVKSAFIKSIFTSNKLAKDTVDSNIKYYANFEKDISPHLTI